MARVSVRVALGCADNRFVISSADDPLSTLHHELSTKGGDRICVFE